MRRSEIVDLAILIDNANPTQSDARWPRETYENALQEVYQEEIEMGVENGLADFFKRYLDFTWPASQVDLVVPDVLKGSQILRLSDITNGTPGSLIDFSEFGEVGLIYWVDAETLRWDRTGPQADVTIRAHFIPVAEPLVTDTSEPKYIPRSNHSLLAWATVVWLKTISLQSVPQMLIVKLQEKRARFWKKMAKGRPTSNTPIIRRDMVGGGPGPSTSGPVAPQDGSSIF